MFYVFAVAMPIIVGAVIANVDTTPTAIAGSILFAFGVLMLSASLGDPFTTFVQDSNNAKFWLAFIGAIGIIMILLGVIFAVAFEHVAMDFLAMFIIGVGLMLIFATGIADPIIRGMLQELHTSDIVR